jgi:uncharacterized protein (DUF433 family)
MLQAVIEAKVLQRNIGAATAIVETRASVAACLCGECSRGGTLKGMPEALNTEPLPLETDPQGIIRVRGTRVTLDTVWYAFNEGATAEEIVQQYPSLSLADVYQVIGYCLRHPSALEAYLAQRSRSAEEVRASNECRWRPEGIRSRLQARRPQ